MKTTLKNLKRVALLATLFLGMNVLMSAESKTPVNVKDLNKNITSYIAKDYAGYTIKDAFKLENNKKVTYDVDVTKGSEALKLVFDSNGKFIKALKPMQKHDTNTSKTSNTGSSKTRTQQK